MAKCLYDNLPLDRTILFLFCPETGTAGYKRNASRRANTPTPELLAATFTRTSNPAVLQAMDDYMAYTHVMLGRSRTFTGAIYSIGRTA